MYLVMMCMTMSFVVPSIRIDYSDMEGLGHNDHEIHILDLRSMGDCILAASAAGRSQGTSFSKNTCRSAKSIINTAGHIMLPGIIGPVSCFTYGISCVPAPPDACTISSSLIRSIHLKDGSK